MGKGSGSGNAVRGYRYYFSILMGLCRGPIDQLVEIKVADKEAWPRIGSYPNSSVNQVMQLYAPGQEYPPGSYADSTGAAVVDSQRFAIVQPTLFGGDTAEGGIAGNAIMLMGGRDQVVPDDVKQGIASGDVAGHTYTYDNAGVGQDTDGGGGTSQPASLVSDFRGVACLFFKGLICSNNPYPKVWKMRVRRTFQGWDKNGCWYPAKARIDLQAGAVRAMNPAHILYQVLTDPIQGRGLPREELDDAAWVYAANWLYDEGLGLCVTWNAKSANIDQFVQMILDHISAALYVDRGTGLMILKLLRADYDPATLPRFGYDSGVMKVENIETASSAVLINEVIVKYQDPVRDKERSNRVHNLASLQSTESVNSVTKSYFGIPDEVVARRVALRDLQISSTDIKKMKITADRRAWRLQPGTVFVLIALDKGIEQLIVRVVEYDDGTIINGAITLTCVQDVFGMPSTVFTKEPDASFLAQPSADAIVVSHSTVYEASYYDMVKALSPVEIAAVSKYEGGVVVVAGKPSPNTTSSLILSTVAGGTTEQGNSGIFSPIGIAKNAVGYYDSVIPLSKGTQLGLVKPGTSALLGNEVVKVISLNTIAGTVTVQRGAVDTVPQVHPAGAAIFFNDAIASAHSSVYAIGETVAVQILPRTVTSAISPGEVTSNEVTIMGRHSKPYPPGNVQINGRYPLLVAGFSVTSDAVVSWASRNKIVQADQLLGTFDSSVIAEPGTTYSIQLLRHGTNEVLKDYTAITGNTFTVPFADITSLVQQGRLDLTLFTVVNNIDVSTAYRIPLVVLAGSLTVIKDFPMSRPFAISFANVPVTAIQDLFAVYAGPAQAFLVHSVTLGCTSATATGNYGVSLKRVSPVTTNGSGGTVAVPKSLRGGTAVASTTAHTNDTVQAVGTMSLLASDAFSFTVGYQYYPAVDDRPIIRLNEAFVVTLDGAPTSAQNVSGTLVIEEIFE